MTEDELKGEFNSLKPVLEKWGNHVDKVLNDYVTAKYASIKEMVQNKASHRVKDENSFIQKALYRKKGYGNPILKITDKVGTRLVLLCSEAVKDVSNYILSRNGIDWDVKENSQDIWKIRVDNPEAFTYQSEHFIVAPIDSYEASVDISLLTCEIQVRTLLQHAYSEISHAFVYKTNKDIDPMVRRNLAASMAFLEEADEKFLYIYKKNMESTKDIRLSLVNELNSEFAKLCSSYQVDKFDREAMEVYIQLLDDNRIHEIKDDFASFVQKNKKMLYLAIHDNQNCYLFTQPISLLALYSFENWQHFTKENWPYGYESLKLVVKALGFSDDVLES